ncbi:TOG array regulator of axonemal microtubules protein 2-like isoform X3 [Oncorhynchus kisutch]|uniref:TOG array regulator of axonemal microtubules protein 2-like isoform X3 n=1 Tax=Oncorhynchus kisutch TaxID=8019 RepID=UPI0012DCFBE2|nr:TOG array regulator of axonemal microtubules protein 2-like isoform X3 [Oncorhynchus kisutch]
MAYRGRKSSEFDKLQKENSQMKSVIENLRKQNMALNQQDDQDKFSSFGYQESYPIAEGHRGFISDARLLQMQRAEREAMEAKQRKISAIHENYVRTALIRVGSTFAHHFVPSIQCIPRPKAPPRPLPRRLEHIALVPLKNVVGVDGAQVRPGSHSLESIQVNKSFSSSSVWPVPVPPTGAPSKRGKKKKGRRGVKALKVQSDQGCADNNGPIDLMEEVRDIEAHLKEEDWKVVHEVKAMGRRSLGSAMSTGEIATSSLGSLSSVDMNTPAELRDYLDVGTPVKSLDSPPRPAPPPTKPRSKQPRPIRFLSLPKAATGSDKMAASEPKGQIKNQARLQPLSNPEQALTKTFKLLHSASDDWEKKIEGLTFLRVMAQNHMDILMPKLHDICLAIINEVKNLRSAVSCAAMATLGDMYVHLQRAMDSEVEGTARVLLHKASEANAFIRQGANFALGHMVQSCTPTRVMNALLVGGLSHRNAAVRSCTAQHLERLAEVMGTARLLSGKKDLTDRFLIAVSKLAVDPSQEVRHHGRKILSNMATNGDFPKMWDKFAPRKERESLREVISKVNLKERPHTHR